MWKYVMVGLLGLSLMILWGTAAQAGCVNVGGTQICASWLTSSEICNSRTTGLGNIKGCDPSSGSCPVVTCSAFGTIPLTSTAHCTNNFDPNNTSCGLVGIAFCANPKGRFSPQGNPFTLGAFLTDATDITSCPKNGRCLSSIELNPMDCPDCCVNANWDFLTFTASEFYAEAKVCPGGYAGNQQCCADMQRTVNHTCVTPGVEVIEREFCSVNLTNIQYGEQRTYTCMPAGS